MRSIVVTANTGQATSNLVRLDEWGHPQVNIQCVLSGTGNYTVQQSMDDPNDPFNPVPVGSMTWFPSADAAVVGATASAISSFSFAPRFVRVIWNSGTGTVTMTVTQYNVVSL